MPAMRPLLMSLALGALLSCSQEKPPLADAPAGSAIERAIGDTDGALLTSGWRRAQIGSETRPVMLGHRTYVLRWNEELPLTERLQISTPLPRELARSSGVLVEHRVSLRDPGLGTKTLAQLGTGGRISIESEPVVLEGPGAIEDEIRSEIEVPQGLRGLEGLLSVIAHALPGPGVVREETRPFDIPTGAAASLEFGYGIEEPGWNAGFPPVHFRVLARSEGGREALVFERRLDPADDERDRRWFDASVSLAAFAGDKVRFVFEAQPLAAAAGARWSRSFPVVSNPEVVVGAERDDRRRNILLISLDTLRAKSLRLYGHERDTMPNLDRRLAGRGAFVRAVVTPIPYTPPAHMTMLTGLEPCAHGVLDRHGILDGSRVTLAEVLRASGYRTAAFTEDAYVVAGAGFERGFDEYKEFRSEESAAPGFVADTFGAAERWLHGRSREPFFLFIHTYQVHDPYTPPRSYGSFFQEPVDAGQPPEVEEILRLYEQEIRYTDDVLAGLLDTLDSEGLSENTIVVVTSDHGEAFSEHTINGHGFTLFDEELLVPLVVRAPGLVPEGLAIEEQVGLVDLAPTLLELVGQSPPEMMQGTSFADLLRGVAPVAARPPRISRLSGADRWSVRTTKYKYIRMPDKRAKAAKPSGRGGAKGGDAGHLKEFVYLHPADAREKSNVARDDPQALVAPRRALDEHHAACRAWDEAHPPSSQSGDRITDLPGWFINRDEIEAKLRSLGYVEP